jgi:hypothetical protein
MLWHLCDPLGVSERTTNADSEFWARRRFVPIPKGWFVASDASYRLGWRTEQDHKALPTVKVDEPRRSDLEHVLLRAPEVPILTTTQAAKRIGCSKNSLHGLMKRYGYHPVAGFASRVGQAGRGERRWVTAEVRRVANIRLSKIGRKATILRAIEYRRTKREQNA